MREGYAVAGTSRSIRASAEEDYLAIPGDVTQPETAERVIQQTLARFGRLDTVINNAGLAELHPLGRLGEIDDIDDGIVHLERATFVTGEILHIDGGQAAGA